MTIQTIIKDWEKLCDNDSELNSVRRQVATILKDSLASMLDEIEKIVSVKKQERSVLEHLYCDGTSNFEDGYNTCCQEVINIINSHR